MTAIFFRYLEIQHQLNMAEKVKLGGEIKSGHFWEAAKKIIFLMAVLLRDRGGGVTACH